MKENSVLAWHFCSKTLRNGEPIPQDGELLVFRGSAVMCQSGLHASRRLMDALEYAPGNTLCRVECLKIQDEKSDKLVCLERRIVGRIDAEELLWKASRKFASDVLHLWRAPDVVKKFLETGAPALRDAARDAARAAAWDAAAWDAARDARGAARAAAGVAASDAASDAASAAAGATARAAARAAAWDARDAAAWDAARDAQNTWLEAEALKLMGLEE